MSTPPVVRDLGVWSAVKHLRRRDLLAVEVTSATALGALSGVALSRYGSEAERIRISGDYLTVAGTLVGVVLACFALVLGLTRDDYIRWLNTTGNGLLGFLRPFLLSVALQVGSLLVVVTYRAVAPHLSGTVEHVGFTLASVAFLLALLDVVALARSVLLHGVARARALQLDAAHPPRD